MKILEKSTAILENDIVVINPKEETFRIKRENTFLQFESFTFNEQNNEWLSASSGEARGFKYNEHSNVWDYLGEIMSCTGLMAVKLTDDPSIKPGEEFWQLKSRT